MIHKSKRRKLIERVQRQAVKSARLVIRAKEHDPELLMMHFWRLETHLGLLQEIDPEFWRFIERYSARSCAAPDCKKLFIRNWGSRAHGHIYHSTSCRSRHNMQRRRFGEFEAEMEQSRLLLKQGWASPASIGISYHKLKAMVTRGWAERREVPTDSNRRGKMAEYRSKGSDL